MFDGLLFVVVLITTWLIARNADRDDDASFSFAPRSKPIPERLRAIWWVRMLPRHRRARWRSSSRSPCRS